MNSYYQTGRKDLIDKAIINTAKDELDTEEINQNYQKIDEIPFDFKRRRMSVVMMNKKHEHLLVTKGAAEEMLLALIGWKLTIKLLCLIKSRDKKF